MSGNPLGQGVFGQARLGDEQNTNVFPRRNALGITYTIVQSQHSTSLALSYTLQRNLRAPLVLYYLIGPTLAFAINGDTTIVAPDQITYTPRPVTNYALSGQPLLQGFKTMAWTWTTIQEPEAMHLLSFYDPQNPQVLLSYPDETGTWVQRQVFMLPPNYGAQETVSVTGLVLTFTGLLS